jgi:predicted Zn finger-like uncharacterized protein
MNTACPSCGAVYAVTPKDVGRKIKCKKCSTALRVDDSGLVVDAPASSPPPPATAAAVVVDEAEGGDEVVVKKKGKKSADRDRDRDYEGGGGGGFGVFVQKIGGVPTILFGFGTFLVIFFTFMTPIGEAGAARAKVTGLRLKAEIESKVKKLLPKGKRPDQLTPDDFKKLQDDEKKIREDYASQLERADENAATADSDNVASALWDKWGQLFGFLFLSFGCIGYLRTEQPLIMKIVAAVVLSFMLMVVFSSVGGGCGHNPIGKG